MDVIDQGGSIDINKLIEYVAKDFPGEFKQIIAARDELAKRQGAIGAVEAAVADRKLAEDELAAAYNKAQQIVIDADAKRREVDEQAADLEAKIAKFEADVAAFNKTADATNVAFKQREAALRTGEEALATNIVVYDAAVAALEADKAALAARIKAFQDKVAALNA